MTDGTIDLVEENERMRAVLKMCAKQFRAYEKHHELKGDYPKAGTNAGFAIMCEGVLEPASSMTPWMGVSGMPERDPTNSPDKSPSFGRGIWCNQCNEFTTAPHFHAGPTEGKKIK